MRGQSGGSGSLGKGCSDPAPKAPDPPLHLPPPPELSRTRKGRGAKGQHRGGAPEPGRAPGAAPGTGPSSEDGTKNRGGVSEQRKGLSSKEEPQTGEGSQIGEGSQPAGRGLWGLPGRPPRLGAPLQPPPQETPEGFRDFPSLELWDRDSSHTRSHPGVLGCPRDPETRSAPKILFIPETRCAPKIPLISEARSVPKLPFIPEIPSIPAQMELGRLDRVRRETEAGSLFPQLRPSQPG